MNQKLDSGLLVCEVQQLFELQKAPLAKHQLIAAPSQYFLEQLLL